ncbi:MULTISPECIES: ABC transporter permease [unclassified Chelatococcus]|uniref:ABC transporter permease n=1 Tax=unclassified Chelatococcus TaxID=2638111 RepID=UPI001BD0EC91|nr:MULTISPECIES: ABC transporter permease [unclassified Chelatococcus]CAH1671197.1 putative spermidine/putrescine transport system permease protein [Hyphomicrobiales bacterium]MBS7739107.1 ABC transporter permease [Chelatococcus sp. HY11]MBX3543542.1 ABC transporter permease [Chelatococcus sp.]MCO5076363.1 ABC transporter permease [Chelatococcus sp.]CAH1676608.1 putative spermidine/putrescine transport system permease protein [Hyphomicrobiales bacterium]
MERRLSSWRVVLNVGVGLVFLFLLMPSVITAIIAFGDSNQIMFPPQGYSLHLFRQFFTEAGWVSSTILSFRIALISALISLILGVPAAYALVRGNFPGRRLLSLFLLSPIMVPHIAIALGLYIYFIRLGVNNGELRLILAHVVAALPFVVVTTGAGVGHIDPALERAATVMGASPLTVLRRVTLPLLAPSIAASGLFAFLISFDEVVISWFVSRAGETTLPVKMFASIQFEVSPILAAISTMLTVMSVLVCLVVAVMQRKSPNA